VVNSKTRDISSFLYVIIIIGDDNMKSFKEALINEDIAELNNIPKIDIHNHAVSSCTKDYLINKGINFSEDEINDIQSLINFSRKYLSPLQLDKEGLELLLKGNFENCINTGIKVVSTEIDYKNCIRTFNSNIEEFINFLKSFKYNDLTIMWDLGISRDSYKEEYKQIIIDLINTKYFNGLDLTSTENSIPNSYFKDFYDLANSLGMTTKVHTGEQLGANYIKECIIDFNPKQIQHGIHIIEDKSVMQLAKEKGIIFNVCPTSNIILGYANSIKEHPIKQMVEYGLKVTIGTDDLLFFDSDINSEYLKLYKEKVLTVEQLDEIRINGLALYKEQNKRFVRVMDGLKSNAGGFTYKLDEINISDKWDTSTRDPEQMGGFNFGTEDKILRWLHRGDTIYDVLIPNDAEVILCDEEKGIYRSNKIIVTNPRIITDDMVIELYKKSTLSNKIIAQCLVTLLWKNRVEISKYIIKDRVNSTNIDEILTEFEKYAGEDNLSSDTGKEIHEILKEIKSPLEISLYVSKEPYIKQLSEDKIINLTGQSGSGKSTYAKEYFNTKEYLIIDTDEVLSEKRFQNTTGINKDLGIMFREKYPQLPDLGEDFDIIYKEILEYCKNIDKTIVIDCAQFHCVKDISILKGKIIIIRTDIETCYNRTITRWISNHNGIYQNEELERFKERKKSIFKWYKNSNEFIRKIDLL